MSHGSPRLDWEPVSVRYPNGDPVVKTGARGDFPGAERLGRDRAEGLGVLLDRAGRAVDGSRDRPVPIW